MKVNKKWRQLGWRHPLWDYVRFYSVVRGQRKDLKENWLENMRASKLEIVPGKHIPINPRNAQLFFEYLDAREHDFVRAEGFLRTVEEALAFYTKIEVEAGKNVTQLSGYYRSSRSLIASVAAVAKLVCDKKNISFVPSPRRRCAWLVANHLHVTARNLDGAIPALANPTVVWEIKGSWAKTKGGRKMSNAVYECNLVGRELKEFEERSGARITHIVFVDGKEQWSHRQSDMKRFIDLFHQGLIDYLFVGRDVESEWQKVLASLI